MSLYFITGASGTGKSTINEELKKRGYKSYDVDEDGLARWQNKKTGYIHPKSSVSADQRTKHFIKMHSWAVQQNDVLKLKPTNNDEPVFVCGSISNEDDLLDLFDQVFNLVITPSQVRLRLLNRSNNSWGKQDHELQRTLESQKDGDKKHLEMGSVMIDATQPVEDVVNEILSSIKQDQSH